MTLKPRLPAGLYDQLVDDEVRGALRALPTPLAPAVEPLERAVSHERLARHFAAELQRALAAKASDESGVVEQVGIVNALLAQLRVLCGEGVGRLPAAPDILLAVYSPPGPPGRPAVPLATSTLLTHARHEPRLGAEIVAEIASADQVDMLVSFVKWHGWRRLKDAFEPFARSGRRLRLLTTTYLGATEKAALDAIARLPGAEVRVSYDVRRTRLHAKAWLFHRSSGFSSAYVGSANVSSAALFDGLEWSLKASEAESPHIVAKFRGAFDSLWEDSEFERYDPEDEAAVRRLAAALACAGGSARAPRSVFFDLRPWPYQEAILAKLRFEREEHGRARNLVVAATGTGKTVIAAFDYRAQVSNGVRPRLLFVAHREEILEQALATFRQVLRDQNFGERLGGGAEPASYEHLFATVQSLAGRDLARLMGPSYWDYVIVDEFHHAAASTYAQLLESLAPRILLGLTATPERADGLDVLHWFDARIAAEIRLWDALEKELLAPFEYYGIADGVSLENVRWVRGGYDLGDLGNLYTGHDARAALVLEKLREIHGRPHEARGLGFTVNVAHAEFMARKFCEVGLPAIALHGGSSDEARATARARLEQREVNFIFTCDLYNEGIDLPFVDTLLLLRPTESATLFLQQLGRGLRRWPGKEAALVLDFIGQAHAQFRYDRKYTAMTGVPRGFLAKAIEDGFPQLPSGCHVQLERVAREVVLANVRQAVRGGQSRLVAELRELARSRPDVRLASFLAATGRELEEVYSRSVGGWTALRRAAGLEPPGDESEAKVGARLQLLLHIDEPIRLKLYQRVAAAPMPDLSAFSDHDRRCLLMLGQRVMRRAAGTLEDLLDPLWRSPALRDELIQLCSALEERVPAPAVTARLPQGWALSVHRTYARDEILAAIGESTVARIAPSREGVYRPKAQRRELLFVTLNKSGKRFSPTTSYDDYAVSARRFHWQSQSTTGAESPTGRRYIGGEAEGWEFFLFVREDVDAQFMFLGPVHYVSHEGSRPMSITWELEVPLPPTVLDEYRTLLAG